MINYSRLPAHIQDGMRLYIERGIPPGHFLTAFLENDLMGAMGRADDINRHAFFEICGFLYNEAPCGCFGSPDRVSEWIKRGGLAGMEAA